VCKQKPLWINNLKCWINNHGRGFLLKIIVWIQKKIKNKLKGYFFKKKYWYHIATI